MTPADLRRIVPVRDNTRHIAALGVQERGFLGVAPDGSFRARPTRGSGGYALYGTAAQCHRHTGCQRVMEVFLRIDRTPLDAAIGDTP